MRIDFNPAKDAINRQNHEGLSLGLASHFDWLAARISPARTVEGERRWKAVVALEGTVYAAIFTLRGADVFWMISLRRASRKERRGL